MKARETSNNYYVNKQRANHLIKEKIIWLKNHPEEQLNIYQLIMDITEQLPIGEKHIQDRIALIMKVDDTISQSEETIYYTG